jgi:uncharacterized membrane protein YuzA (DUF378 family)
MDYKHHLHPDRLERYSFLWSEARLVIAAVALFIGGTPPLIAAAFALRLPILGLIVPLLTLAWILSGAASAYLLYRWFKGGQRVFGGKDKMDTAAFFVSVVSGLNLGLAGLLSRNIGMSIFPGYVFFVIAGLAYLVSAWHLYRRWKSHGEKVVS